MIILILIINNFGLLFREYMLSILISLFVVVVKTILYVLDWGHNDLLTLIRQFPTSCPTIFFFFVNLDIYTYKYQLKLAFLKLFSR